MAKKNIAASDGAYLILGQPELADSIEIGRRYDLKPLGMLISNQKEADIPVPTQQDVNYSVFISGNEKGWAFENRGTVGSILLNGFMSEERRLRDGDLLQIGKTVFHFLEGVGVLSGIYDQMFRVARVDLQTEAYNKVHFPIALEGWINLSKRHSQSLSMMYMDIDHFKRVNDTYGHWAGDIVLRQVAKRIMKRARKEDVFCRIGGEEFALILPETPKDNAMSLAEEIRQEIAKEPCIHKEKGLSIPVTISIGVGEYQEGMSLEAFGESVDQKLYEAKHTGRNKVAS